MRVSGNHVPRLIVSHSLSPSPSPDLASRIRELVWTGSDPSLDLRANGAVLRLSEMRREEGEEIYRHGGAGGKEEEEEKEKAGPADEKFLSYRIFPEARIDGKRVAEACFTVKPPWGR